MLFSQKIYNKIELFSIIILLVLCDLYCAIQDKEGFLEKYMDVPLDHFTANSEIETFKLRYLINSDHYKKDGPIFVLIGNEEDIHLQARNYGFLVEMASEFEALLVYIEHRYYGESLPFGNVSFTSLKNLKYLSTTQALADFAYIIDQIKEVFFENSLTVSGPYRIIAFGGSYGGMMATWLRMKYPHLVLGSISSSAPIFWSPNFDRCDAVYKKVTSIFEESGSKQCTRIIELVWDIVTTLGQTQLGMDLISTSWKLCKRITSIEEVEQLLEWLSRVYVKMASMNYPFPYKKQFVAYPVKTFCNKLSLSGYNGTAEMIESFNEAIQIFTNFTKTKTCNDIGQDFTEFAWDYQSCTEFIRPMCSSTNDMFITRSWNYDKFKVHCFQKFGIKYYPDTISLNYGNGNFQYSSNMLFVNNMLDPFSDYGFYLNVSESIKYINISNSVTLMDFRESNLNDDSYILKARSYIFSVIDTWLKSV